VDRARCGSVECTMKRFFLLSGRCKPVAALLLAAWIAAATPGQASGNTARMALDDVRATAKDWQPDAILTSIYTASADADGKADAWDYGFYSPKNGNYLNVTAKGRSIDTLQIAVGQTAAVPSDFLDSNEVVAAAAKAGMKSDSMRMRLTKAQWLVNNGDQKGDMSLWLNPRTGRVIKRQRVQ
jgi:hypothetical protein